MSQRNGALRVLYSFPHRLGASRICYTAWQQVNGLAAAGARVVVFASSFARPMPSSVRVHKTLAAGRLRVPYRVLGNRRAMALHDRIVAYRLRRAAGEFDVVHVWPSGAIETIRAARKLNIPALLERPNSHTRFAYEVVQKESERIGVALPRGFEHSFNATVLEKEEREFELADVLLCPSKFTADSFRRAGFPETKLAEYFYGYDQEVFQPGTREVRDTPFTMVFAGLCAVRKGLHFALEAWLKSPAHEDGQFLIAGDFLPAYRDKLAAQLAHPSIRVLGHRNDIPELMRQSHVLVLPSIEEGCALVCMEAMGSGCVPLVSDVCTDRCVHGRNALVHAVRDVETLAQHITSVYRDRELLRKLREEGLRRAPSLTWKVSGEALMSIYLRAMEMKENEARLPA